ncbi:MAG: GAF and ANTAR domain-containing protein [Ilumatobacteraceae bacterium]
MVDTRRLSSTETATASEPGTATGTAVDADTSIDDARDLEVALSFAKIARVLASEHTEDAVYERVVDMALDTIDGADHAGIFVMEGGVVRGKAVSDEFVNEIDAIQLAAAEGPCLDAMLDPHVTYCCASDLSIALEWPSFGPRACNLGLRSVFSVRLFADRPVALNLYGRLPAAFGAVDRTKGLILASHAGTALMVVESRLAEIKRSHDLQSGLEMRSVIGQAQGIMMERERITATQAFDVLRRASQDLNLKLRDIAQRLVDTGEDPLITGRSADVGSVPGVVGVPGAPHLVHVPGKSARSD